MSSHFGEEKTLERIKQKFYWPGHYNNVHDWCKTCAACATTKTPVPRNKASLKPIIAGYPMRIVAIDIVGPLPESDAENSYILVVGDYFTHWMEAFSNP